MFKIIKSNSVNMEDSVVILQKKESPAGPVEEIEHASGDNDSFDETNIKLDRIGQTCDEMIRKAQVESDTILQNARIEIEELKKANELEMKRLKKESESAGYDQGYERGYSESLFKYKELIEEAKSIVTDAEMYKVDTVNSMEGGVIELVTACVEKIVRKSLDENDEILLNVIKGAMESITNRDHISIKVSQEDYKYVDMAKERLLAQFPGIKSIDIHIDDAFKKGDLEIESESGTVNPSISQQIKKLVNEFDKLFSNEELM